MTFLDMICEAAGDNVAIRKFAQDLIDKNPNTGGPNRAALVARIEAAVQEASGKILVRGLGLQLGIVAWLDKQIDNLGEKEFGMIADHVFDRVEWPINQPASQPELLPSWTPIPFFPSPNTADTTSNLPGLEDD